VQHYTSIKNDQIARMPEFSESFEWSRSIEKAVRSKLFSDPHLPRERDCRWINPAFIWKTQFDRSRSNAVPRDGRANSTCWVQPSRHLSLDIRRYRNALRVGIRISDEFADGAKDSPNGRGCGGVGISKQRYVPEIEFPYLSQHYLESSLIRHPFYC